MAVVVGVSVSVAVAVLEGVMVAVWVPGRGARAASQAESRSSLRGFFSSSTVGRDARESGLA